MTSNQQNPPRQFFDPISKEGRAHRNGKEFLADALRRMHIENEDEADFQDAFSGKTYYTDLYAHFTNNGNEIKIDIEVDGPKGHNSEHNLDDDYNKQLFMKSQKISTVRFTERDLQQCMNAKDDTGINQVMTEILFRLVDGNEPKRGVY